MSQQPGPVGAGAAGQPRSEQPEGEQARSEQARSEQALTGEVIASFAGAQSPRYREIMEARVRHLHGFAAEVRLTEAEWQHGIDFLTRAGHLTDARRQEFVLLSDVLGLSMLTVRINAVESDQATRSTVLGPFYLPDTPEIPAGGDITGGAKGRPCHVSGTLRGTDGEPVPDARIEVWQADQDGRYDVQYAGGAVAGRGWLLSGPDGEYRFWAVHPGPYPIPQDGPAGELLAAAGRGPMRPAHVHIKVSKPGYRTLTTHVFAAGDPYLADDAVFGVTGSLVADFAEQPPGPGPEGRQLDGPWTRVTFDIVLALQPGQPR